jgi:hypothetical protein
VRAPFDRGARAIGEAMRNFLRRHRPDFGKAADTHRCLDACGSTPASIKGTGGGITLAEAGAAALRCLL